MYHHENIQSLWFHDQKQRSMQWVMMEIPQGQAGVGLIRWCKSSFQLGVESNCDYTDFALLCSVIGLENCHHSLNHSNAETKPKTRLLTFFPCFKQSACFYHMFLLPSCNLLLPMDWWLWLLIGFGGTILNWKAPEVENSGGEMKVKTRTVNKRNSKDQISLFRCSVTFAY